MQFERPTIDLTMESITAKRVHELVARYGKTYVAGELSGERETLVTGSDIPSICGENRFEKPNDKFFKKAYGVHMKDTEATLHGKHHEPIAIDKFKAKYKAEVFFVSFMRHEDHPYIGGTFDGLAILPSGEGVLLEVKCPFSRSIASGKVPEHYIGQVQTYLAIAKLDTCLFVQYKPSYVTPAKRLERPEKLIVTTIKYDPDYIKDRLYCLWDFWARIKTFKVLTHPLLNPAATVIQRAYRQYKSGSKIGQCPTGRLLQVIATFKSQRLSLLANVELIERVKSECKLMEPEIGPLLVDFAIDHMAKACNELVIDGIGKSARVVPEKPINMVVDFTGAAYTAPKWVDTTRPKAKPFSLCIDFAFC